MKKTFNPAELDIKTNYHLMISGIVPRPIAFVSSISQKGDFMSRKGIGLESITYHPMGLPHGPQPGKYEASIGKKWTDELAVMIDTFKPLNITQNAIDIEDKKYYLSWL